jgi:uncharacterized damage-inducible protein DinB
MANYADLFEYDAWANNQVLEVASELTDEQLRAPMDDLGGSVVGLLDHTAKTAAMFLGLMTGTPKLHNGSEDLATIRAAFATLEEKYAAAMPDLVADSQRRFTLTWAQREFTVEQGLLQVVTHSVQHRAGICAGIARAGRETPGLDYVQWLNEFR